jgi:hypothetical protein
LLEWGVASLQQNKKAKVAHREASIQERLENARTKSNDNTTPDSPASGTE